MRLAAYIDGFNLYYGAVKGTPYKWLDLNALVQLLFPAEQIVALKYFTALVKPRPGDPHNINRQLTYLRALKTRPAVEIIYGTFLAHEVSMVLGSSPPGSPQFVKVVKTEEKGSDVNLATHMIHDGHRGRYDLAVLVTNDSDLTEPVRIVTQEVGLRVAVVNPHPRQASRSLIKYATAVRQIRPGLLAASQLPAILTDANGTIHKPPAW